MAIEIVDLPINSMVISHRYVAVYQRVSLIATLKTSARTTEDESGQMIIHTAFKKAILG